MEQIMVRLCGNPEVRLGGRLVTFPYRKVDGFLYYLCVKKSVSRDEMISLLWCDEDETAGKKKLRDAVYQVKRALGKDVLVTTGNTGISLNTARQIDIDIDAVKSGRRQADELFLNHFYIKNCYEFEEWVESVREELQKDVSTGVREKLSRAAAEGDLARMQEYGNLLLKNDPYEEDLYYEIMNMYAESGNYTMAIRIYYDLAKLLRKDMGVEPSRRVKDLFHRIFTIKENLPDEVRAQEMSFFVRKKELLEVSGLLDQPATDRVNCLAIEGREGVGKSEFIHQCIRLAEGKKMLPLSAICYRQGTDFFLSPWKDIFYEIRQNAEGGMLGDVLKAGEVEELGRLFANGAMGGAENGRAAYQMIEQMLTEALVKISEHYRLLMTFDEIQWMDQLSLQLLIKVLHLIRPERMKMICSYDQSLQTDAMLYLEPLLRNDRIRFMTLLPFTETETNEILHRSLPELDNEPEKRRDIYELTNGNAFFLREIVNNIREKGYTLEKSGKIKFMVRSRLSELSAEQKEILNCMSVFPEKISAGQVELLLQGIDRLTLVRELEELREKGLIQEVLVGWNVYYKFVHRLFREYIYEQQGVGKRQMYHRMLAEYYEKREGENFAAFPQIAWHYARCNEEVRSYRYQIRYLREYYTIMNESFPIIHTEVSDLGNDIGVMTEAEKMLELAKNVIRLEGDTGEVGHMKMEMYYILGRHDIAVGEYESGIDSIERSMRLSEALGMHRNLLSCYKQMIFHGIQVGDLNEVEDYIERGMRQIGEDEPEELATFLRLKGWYLTHKERYDEAGETLGEAIRIFRSLEKEGEDRYNASISACLKYIGDIHRHQKEYIRAMSYYQEAVQTDQNSTMMNALAQIYTNIGQVKYAQGRYAESYIYLDKAREALEKNGYYWGLERAEAYLALVCLKSGRSSEARLHYDKGRMISEKIGNPTTQKILEEAQKMLS